MRTSSPLRTATPTAVVQWHTPTLPEVSLMHDLYREFFYSASGWTVILGCLVLAIAQTFEELTHAVKYNVPKNLLPVVNAVLFEVSVLGFSGLVIGTLGLRDEKGWLGQISATFLGDAAEAFELFEGVDESIFPVTMAFIAAAVALIAAINRRFNAVCGSTQLDTLNVQIAEEEAQDACTDAECTSDECLTARTRLDRLQNIKVNGLWLSSFAIDDTDGVRANPALDAYKDLFAPNTKRRAEFLRFRARFLEQSAEWGVSKDFAFGRYLQESAAQTLAKLVVVEPIQLAKVWVPICTLELLVLQAFGGLEDGAFLPRMMCLGQLPITVWTLWNYLRLWSIRSMLLPQVGRVQAPPQPQQPQQQPPQQQQPQTAFRLLPPKYKLLGGALKSRQQRGLSIDTYDRLAFVESLYPADASNEHEALFGRLGKNGPAFYLNSMKLVLFSAVVSLAFVGSGGAVGPATEAATALASALGSSAAEADALAPSLSLLTSALLFFPSVLAVALAPYTFLCYNWVTSVEGLRRQDLTESITREQRSERFRSTLGSLSALSEWIEQGLSAAPTVGRAPAVTSTALPASRRTQKEVERRWALLVETVPIERLLDVRALFDSQDTDRSGSIGLEEVSVVLRQLGFRPSAAQLGALFERMDVDGSGQVGFREFATAVVGASAASKDEPFRLTPEARERIFNFFDEDGSGAIDEAEMLSKLGGLGFDLNGVGELFREMGGLNSDGSRRDTVTRKKFMRYLERYEEEDNKWWEA